MSGTTPAAIEALLKDVTPGPWHWNVRGFVGPISTDDDQSFGMICDEVAECTFSNGSKESNARFIAAARDLVPALAAERDAAIRERDNALALNTALAEANDGLGRAAYSATARAEKAETEAAAILSDPRVKALVEAAAVTLHDIDDLVANSEGVAGLHMNGDVACWESIMDGGAFGAWLSSVEKLRLTLAALK